MVRKIGMDRDESWRKVEIFSVTTIDSSKNVQDISMVLVRFDTVLVRLTAVATRANRGAP